MSQAEHHQIKKLQQNDRDKQSASMSDRKQSSSCCNSVERKRSRVPREQNESSESKGDEEVGIPPPGVREQAQPNITMMRSSDGNGDGEGIIEKEKGKALELAPPTLVPPREEEDVRQIAQTAPFHMSVDVEEQENTMNVEDAASAAVFPGAYRIGGADQAQDDNGNDDDTIFWASNDPTPPAMPDATDIQGVLAPDAEEIQRIAIEEAKQRIRHDTVAATNVLAEGPVVQTTVPANNNSKKKWILVGVVVVIVVALVAVGILLALTLGRSTSNSASSAPWIQLGPDIDGEAVGDWSGHSVSLSEDGMTLAIGASKNNGNGIIDSGHVRVLQYWHGSWVQLGQDIDGQTRQGQSGRSVSMSASGNMVAIGAPYAHSKTGYVQVYRWEGDAWAQVGSDMNGTAAGDRFGYSISLSSDGSYVVVGGDQPYSGDSNNLEGYAHVYHLEGSDWNLVGQTLVGEAAGDEFGSSVSMSGDGKTIAIGGRSNNGNGQDSGHVQVYHLEGNNWIQVGQDIDGEAPKDYSGRSIALSANGTTVAIGAWGNNNSFGIDAGHVRVYTLRNGTSWRQVGQDIDGKAADDEFGVSVALSDDGTFLAAGATQYQKSLPGYVSVYQFVDGSWEQVGPDLIGEDAGDWFGYSISMSGDGRTIAVGGPLNDGSGEKNSGHVCVYQLMN